MKLLMATRMGDPYFSLLDDFKDVEIAWAGSPDEVARQIVDADAVYGWPTREQFLAAKRLKWIQVPSAGVEMLCSIPEIVESDVVMTNARGAHARVIAEHAFAMLLAFTRGILPFEQDKAARRWRREQAIPEVQEIAGWTIGIVGYGQIGQQVTQRALGFEMAVLAVDVAPMPDAPHGVDVWGPDRLPELMERSDVVVVATPYTPRTRQMLGADLLGRMKPTAYLLVVSRGGIVDEPALVEAVQTGRLAGAGLDTTAREPLPPDDPLLKVDNIVVTPHYAGGSRDSRVRGRHWIYDNVARYLRGETPERLVTADSL